MRISTVRRRSWLELHHLGRLACIPDLWLWSHRRLNSVVRIDSVCLWRQLGCGHRWWWELLELGWHASVGTMRGKGWLSVLSGSLSRKVVGIALDVVWDRTRVVEHYSCVAICLSTCTVVETVVLYLVAMWHLNSLVLPEYVILVWDTGRHVSNLANHDLLAVANELTC